MIKIAINGFGRVGRTLARLVLQSTDCELVVINELDPDIKNLVYLLSYDSIYGRFPQEVILDEPDKSIICGDKPIRIYSYSNPEDVPWQNHDFDVLIDATGVNANVLAAHTLVKQGIPKVIITHSPSVSEVDTTIIFGVNESIYDPSRHHVVSSSICDAIAIAPVLYEMHNKWGIENCFFTTLHPWLSYQNLLDGPVSSISSPGHFWKDYSLGRNSVLNLIPKNTTAASAVLKVIPELEGKIDAISFRIPSHIVSASDLTILLQQKVSADEIHQHFQKKSQRENNVFELQEDFLVSIDYLGTNKSAIIDANRTKILGDRMVKMVVWYDNEWGYSNKVVDVARLLIKKESIVGRQ